ncbi:MAG: transglutaminaseTgpA domain-containing protein [Zoogloeaceae bacterium]|jgi:transglutaminase-like putative cysteine protease|nr:transglutaminaseTgpA domain-containing protein [Zoogloeaceae bacterium]
MTATHPPRHRYPALLPFSCPPQADWLLSLTLCLLALATHFPALPLFAWPVFFLALGSRFLPRRFWAAALRLVFLSVVVITLGLLHGWLDDRTLRLSLMLALLLKWAEAKTAREFVLLAGAALLAGAIGVLQWNEWIGLILILLLSIVALGVLEAASDGRRSVRAALLRNSGRILMALPLAAVLFLFFPRIPGPLWDIGLSFGLPLTLSLEKSNQGLGVSTRLKPGQEQTQAGVAESQPVLVAEFENWVPPTALLYWRGPVYYDFDGQEWRLDTEYEAGQGRKLMRRGWTKASVFGETLKRKGQEIRYQVRITPHERLWLYGLDLPSGLTSEAFISQDWQVLSHRPIREETSYHLSSWLDWEAGGALSEALRQRALALPPNGNPRLKALGAELAALPDVEDRYKAVLASLAREGYTLRDQFAFQEGADAFDNFWFETRTGNADLYAGAFVFLMRAADVPARLVTGYRGGKLVALTDYVIVKKSHAHAWAEIWEEARGWRRIDPIDLIAPERFESTAATRPKSTPNPTAPKPKTEPSRPVNPPKTPAPTPQQKREESPAGAFNVAVSTPASSGWHLPDLGDFLGRWIFRLDAGTQQSLIGGLGGGFAWVWLLGGATLGSALVMVMGQLLAQLRAHRRLPPPEREWRRICRLLRQHGFSYADWECPSDFARRVAAARPRWKKEMTAFTLAYTDWRYAAGRADAPMRAAACARRLYNLILADVQPIS